MDKERVAWLRTLYPPEFKQVGKFAYKWGCAPWTIWLFHTMENYKYSMEFYDFHIIVGEVPLELSLEEAKHQVADRWYVEIDYLT
jgi:hypothetical protein